jgi:biopolymer transport protein ExbB
MLSFFQRSAALVGAFVLAAIISAPVTHAQSVPAATPAAAASVAAPTAAAATETSAVSKPTATGAAAENPYGLKALWEAGDFIAHSTLIILALMSMATWYVMVTKIWEQSKLKKQAKAAEEAFATASSVRQCADSLKEDSAFRYIAEQGVEATRKHDGLLGQVDLNSWVTMSIQRAMDNVQSRLQDGLAVLATVGSTAPFVGLFGTVMGIYNALVKIGTSGQASIDKVAGPVGESLIMTAIGLFVAVPAVLGYNWLVRRNKGCLERVRAFGNDLHSVLLASSNAKR